MSVGLALAITAAVVVVAVGALLFLRRLAPPEGFWGRPEPNHSGSAMAVLGSAFAILMAFVMFLAFQSFINAKRSADAEADATQRLFQTADLFGPRLRDDLQRGSVCYARAVIVDEWPKMRDLGRSELVDRWAFRLERAAERADFSDPMEREAFSEWIESDRLRAEGRRERLQEAAPFVPALLWVALIAGGIALLGYVCTFANPSIRAGLQIALVSAVATIGALNLCVIRFLDTPYEDVAGAIKPSSMTDSLVAIETEVEERFPRLTIPCDQTGAPAKPA